MNEEEYKNQLKKIEQMKNASTEENWDLFQQTMRSILCLINHEALITLLAVYVKQFIDEYLQINPQYKYEYSITILDNGQLTEATIENISVKFDGHKGEPGVNEFRKAVLKLHDLSSLEYCTTIYMDTLVSSIINLFLAIPGQNWGAEHPDLWYQWLRGTKKEDSLILAKYYNKDPKRIEKSRLLRNQLIDYISEYLHKNA